MKTTANTIPFLDLVTPHEELREELCGVLITALGTAGFIGGPMVEEFEEEFAKFCDVRYCVGVANGTDALRFALMAAGVKQGDIVVTVPNTFIATGEAISQAGAAPNFVDVDERTYNLDPAKLRDYLEIECYFDEHAHRTINRSSGKPVTAIVPVHLYGQMAEMDPILELAQRYNILVIEDACQAHGAEYYSEKHGSWKKAGSMGTAAAFSFYPGKNLGACGEAGAVATNDAELAQRVRMLRDHGQSRKYYHDMEGYNGRLDAIQAGFLRVKLNHLAEWNEKRRECARRYSEFLGCGQEQVTLPHEPCWAKSVHHLYVIRSQKRDELQRHLGKADIGTAIHYPIPLHLQKAYGGLGYTKGDFPVSESAARKILSLPMYPGLTCDQQNRVVEQVLDFASATSPRELIAASGLTSLLRN